jgi:hypothetical protein
MARGPDADQDHMQHQASRRASQQLSTGAYVAWMTLRDHPRLTSALAIADGPYRIGSVDETRIEAGLLELERLGLASHRDFRAVGGWHLTRAGLDLT